MLTNTIKCDKLITMKNELLKTKKDKQQFKQWLEALRSGKYKQSKGLLQNSNGYCCLGVACEVLIDEDKKKRYSDSGYLYGAFPAAQTNAPQWLKGITSDFYKRTTRDLFLLNDQGTHNFEEIADILEIEYIHGVE